jgi:hypothetical protein
VSAIRADQQTITDNSQSSKDDYEQAHTERGDISVDKIPVPEGPIDRTGGNADSTDDAEKQENVESNDVVDPIELSWPSDLVLNPENTTNQAITPADPDSTDSPNHEEVQAGRIDGEPHLVRVELANADQIADRNGELTSEEDQNPSPAISDDEAFEIPVPGRSTAVDLESPQAASTREVSIVETAPQFAHTGPSTEIAPFRSDLPITTSRPATPHRSVSTPETYLRWNRVLVQHCFFEAPPPNGPLHFIVTPGVLATALYEVEGESFTPEEAEADLLEAVRLAYRCVILEGRNSVSVLSACDDDGVPMSAAFLAVSILAAFQMRTDESANARGYYVRLSEQLQCEMAGSSPQGLDLDAFDNLWISLNGWIQEQTNETLALPPGDLVQRHIAYPLAHVLLRRVDIEKLPELFESLGLEPGTRIDHETLGQALEGWNQLSSQGRQALLSDRRGAVEDQVATELEAWDGSANDRFGGRTASVQVYLRFARSRPMLQFLPRRTSAFPATFDDGQHAFEAADDRYYEPVAIRAEDGPLLSSGFKWTSGSLSLQRPPCQAISLRPGIEMSGFISNRGLPIGERSAVLCTDAAESAVRGYLNAVTRDGDCQPIIHDDIPTGWRLFRDIVPTVVVQPPGGLDGLAVDTSVSVQFQGGLRLGRKAVWLKGAPPKILVSAPSGLDVMVDGRQVELDGGLVQGVDIDTVGVHLVEIGRVKRKFEIAEAHYVPGEGRALCGECVGAETHPVALPMGNWTVIGRQPEDVHHPGLVLPGTIVRVPFPPQWAITVGAAKGATVALSLGVSPLGPIAGPGTRVSEVGKAWIRLIRSAHVRHPKLGTLTGSNSEADLASAWGNYWQAARSLRRRWKRRP